MIDLSSILDNIKEHVKLEYPRESCGLVVNVRGKLRYVPCTNLAVAAEQFIISPEDYALAEDLGEIACIVHSHPNGTPKPSQADLVSCEKTQLPWAIISWPSEQLNIFEPSGYKPPLTGRIFTYGALDCYTLVKDYYKEVLNIELGTPVHRDGWWLRGENLYLDNAEGYGFVQVSDGPKEHDVILMAVASPVPSHAAVYVGNNQILHHQVGRLSTKDIYTGWYQKVTTHIFRHKDLL